VHSPTSHQIRIATPEDAASIADAHLDSIRSLGAAAYPAGIVHDWCEAVRPQLYVDAMRAGEVFFIAVEEREHEPVVLGFASNYRIDDRHFGASVYVRGGAGRRGIGSQLYQQAEAHARQRGAAIIELDASLGAVPFYRANGFEEIGRGETILTTGRSMPCVFMRKRLTG
jgi:putative acetyltransferase